MKAAKQMAFETVPEHTSLLRPAAVSDCLLRHCCGLPALACGTSLLLQQQTASWPGCRQAEGQQAGEWVVRGWVERVQPGVVCRR